MRFAEMLTPTTTRRKPKPNPRTQMTQTVEPYTFNPRREEEEEEEEEDVRYPPLFTPKMIGPRIEQASPPRVVFNDPIPSSFYTPDKPPKHSPERETAAWTPLNNAPIRNIRSDSDIPVRDWRALAYSRNYALNAPITPTFALPARPGVGVTVHNKEIDIAGFEPIDYVIVHSPGKVRTEAVIKTKSMIREPQVETRITSTIDYGNLIR